MRIGTFLCTMGAVFLLALPIAADSEDEDRNVFRPFVMLTGGLSTASDLAVESRGEASVVLYPGFYTIDPTIDPLVASPTVVEGPYSMSGPGWLAGGTLGFGNQWFDHQFKVSYRKSQQELTSYDLQVLTILYQPTVKLPLRVMGCPETAGICNSWLYLGIGLGGAQAKTKLPGVWNDTVNKAWVPRPVLGIVDGWSFAYQIALGFVFSFTRNIAVDVGYRYLGTVGFTVDTDPLLQCGIPNCNTEPLVPVLLREWNMSYSANEFSASLRFDF